MDVFVRGPFLSNRHVVCTASFLSFPLRFNRVFFFPHLWPWLIQAGYPPGISKGPHDRPSLLPDDISSVALPWTVPPHFSECCLLFGRREISFTLICDTPLVETRSGTWFRRGPGRERPCGGGYSFLLGGRCGGS